MKKQSLSLLLACAAALVNSTGCSTSHYSSQVSLPAGGAMMFSGDVLGHQYFCVVRSEDITNAPAWSAGRDNPPVSVREAARLATKSLAETLGDLKGWSRSEITLHEWPAVGYWIYQIKFEGPSYTMPNTRLNSESVMTVVVLMNGQVICPKPNKQQ
jgi:hypothetical protein